MPHCMVPECTITTHGKLWESATTEFQKKKVCEKRGWREFVE